jgi:hypothetical protein
MATYSTYASVGLSSALVASLAGYYDAVTITVPATNTGVVWLTTSGTAAVAGADDCVPAYPGQTIVIPNQEGVWYQGESTVQYGSNNQWGQCLNGGRGTGARSDPGTQVYAIATVATATDIEIIGD